MHMIHLIARCLCYSFHTIRIKLIYFLLISTSSLLIIFLSFSQSVSQVRIICTIVDSTSKSPLTGASLYVLDKNTNEVIADTISDSKGFCSLEAGASPNMSAVVSIQMLGYKKRLIALSKSQTVENLGEIMLVPESSKLREITVKSTKNIVKFSGNVMNFDVNSIANKKYMTTSQLLQYLPFIQVDEGSNKIRMMGQDLVILVNGQPNAYYNNPQALNNLPTEAIDHIEVKLIATGRYSGKVMNIILKKNYFLGWNGNAGINGSRYSAGGNGHISYWTNKLGIDAAINYNYNNLPGHDYQQILSYKENTNVQQNNNLKTIRSSGSFYTSMFYKLDSLNTLDFNWNASPSFPLRTTSGTNIIISDSTLKQTIQYSKNNKVDKNYSHNISLNYTHDFKQNDRQFFILTNYNTAHDNGYYDFMNTEEPDLPLLRQTNENRNANKEGTIEMLYQDNGNDKLKYDAGGKVIKRWYNNYNNQETWDYPTPDPVNIVQVWLSKYNQTVSSAYGDIELGLKKFVAHAGLRFEYESDHYTMPVVYHQTYVTLIPNISLTFNANPHHLFILSYTRNVQRPAFDFMAQATTLNSAYIKDSGNAYLKPQYHNNYALQYYGSFKFGRIGLNLGYDKVNNGIEYSYYSVETAGSLMKSSTNIHDMSAYTLGIDLDIPVTSRFRISHFSSGSLTAQNSGIYHSKVLTGYLNDKVFYMINRKQAIILRVNGYTANVTLQGKEGGRLSAGITYSIYAELSREKFPAQFTISITNPWYPNGTPNHSLLTGPGFSYYSRNYAPNAIVGIGFNITFKGKRYHNKTFEQSKVINNADIKQSE